MGHQLTLQIPDDLYQPLTQVADKMGQTPEELILKYLTQVVQVQAANDPIEKFIGAFNGDVPDWLERHDDYLGQSQLARHAES
jgi:antitoxin component of RelBE/YafQ-DinJ toxin-antitoxin module